MKFYDNYCIVKSGEDNASCGVLLSHGENILCGSDVIVCPKCGKRRAYLAQPDKDAELYSAVVNMSEQEIKAVTHNGQFYILINKQEISENDI